MFNGNRLDWCLKWSEDCGRPAADAYCQAQGFVKALQFIPDRHIGSRSPTRLIGTGATCDLARCDGFRQITCLKQSIVVAQKAERPKVSTAASMPRRLAGARLASAGPLIVVPPLPTPRPTLASTSARGASLQLVGTDDGEVREVTVATARPEESAEPPAAKADATQLASASAAAAPKPARTFDKPTYNGKRLAWCRQFDAECGKPAADAFCKANGFALASDFSVDRHIGDVQPTRSIGSGAVCDQAPCDGFAVIACSM
jgi:hypothetical protein